MLESHVFRTHMRTITHTRLRHTSAYTHLGQDCAVGTWVAGLSERERSLFCGVCACLCVCVRARGTWYDPEDDYWFNPWEIEARGYEAAFWAMYANNWSKFV